MSTGYTMGGIECAATTLDATRLWCTSVPPGGGSTITTCAPSLCTIDSCVVRFTTALAYQDQTIVLAPTDCVVPLTDSERYTDGMALGWGVATVIIAVYVIRRVFR